MFHHRIACSDGGASVGLPVCVAGVELVDLCSMTTAVSPYRG
jgi:hypothetical protein